MRKAVGNFQAAALFGRFSTIAVQATQLGAASLEMPVGAYTKRLAKLMTGQLDWRGAFNSDFIQRRLKTQPVMIQEAMQRLALADSPGRIKNFAAALGRLIGGTDALMTAGTYAILLDYHKSQGLSDADAHLEATRSTERVAQPTRMGTKSLAEINATNPLAKLSWLFASEARQKLSIAAWAHEEKPAVAAKKMFIAWYGMGIAAATIKAAVRDMKDDDEERFDWKRIALEGLAGPLNGIPFSAFWQRGRTLPDPSTMFRANGDEPVEDIARDVDSLLMAAAPLNAGVSALAGISHAGRDLLSMADNAYTDEEEKGLRQLEREAMERKEATEAAETKEQKAAEEAQKQARREAKVKEAAERAE
jgi:hypothetical protein